MRDRHFAGGDFRFGSSHEAEVAAAESAVVEAGGRPEGAASHRPPGVYIAEARRRVERRTGSIVGEVLEAGLVGFGSTEDSGVRIAGEGRLEFREPIACAPLNCCGSKGIRYVQCIHACLKTKCVEGMDGKGSVAALGAAGTAGEPMAGAPRRFCERCIHDLNELGVAYRKRHAKSISEPNERVRSCAISALSAG